MLSSYQSGLWLPEVGGFVLKSPAANSLSSCVAPSNAGLTSVQPAALAASSMSEVPCAGSFAAAATSGSGVRAPEPESSPPNPDGGGDDQPGEHREPQQDATAELQAPAAYGRGGLLAFALEPLLAPCFLLLLTTRHPPGQG